MLTKTSISLLAFQLFMLGELAFGPWREVVQLLTCSALALLLWIELDGRLPALVAGGSAALALAAGSPTAALGALATGLILFLLKGKPSCAESSAP